MNKYTLKFERYSQEVAFVNIKAKSLKDAIRKSCSIDIDDIDWEEESLVDGERLYGVQDENDEWKAIVQLSHLLGVPTWFNADLRDEMPIVTEHELSSSKSNAIKGAH